MSYNNGNKPVMKVGDIVRVSGNISDGDEHALTIITGFRFEDRTNLLIVQTSIGEHYASQVHQPGE